MDVMLDNLRGAELYELEAEFSQFGQIASMYKAGIYIILTFENETDAEKCLYSMKNHEYYNVRIPCREKLRRAGIYLRDKKSQENKVEEVKSKAELTELQSRSRKVDIKKPEQSIRLIKEERLNGAELASVEDPCPVCRRPLPIGMRHPHGYIMTKCGKYMPTVNQPVNSVGVIVRNFPLYYWQANLYKLCENYADVLHVEIVNRVTPYEMPYAYVFVRTLAEADELVKNLNNTTHRGKIMQAMKVADLLIDIN